MKFRDPKTGKVFDNMKDALEHYCLAENNRDVAACGRCVIGSSLHTDDTICTDFSVAHPVEAARLMGYEVIREAGDLGESGTGPDNPGAPGPNGIAPREKPRLAEVLGVEVGEEFSFPYPNRAYDRVYVTQDGVIRERDTTTGNIHRLGSRAVCWLINHPESIIRRAPRLTEAELERCRVCGVKYLARDKDSAYVTLYAEKPMIISPGYYGEEEYIGYIDAALFPSVEPGDCICVEEAIPSGN